jgi:hypothetical protein
MSIIIWMGNGFFDPGWRCARMTMYLCIKCGKSWELENGDLDSSPSGSLCKPCLKECLIPIYRKRQLQEGNFDCYGKAGHYCDQLFCKYRELCLTEGLRTVQLQGGSERFL